MGICVDALDPRAEPVIRQERRTCDLEPGSYDLLAVKGTLKGSELGVAIVARQITTVDLFIQ